MKEPITKISVRELEELRQMKREFEKLKNALRVTYKIVQVPIALSMDENQIEFKSAPARKGEYEV